MLLLLSWDRFQMLLPIRADFEYGGFDERPRYGELSALLLAESSCAPLNPPEWIRRWNPQLVLLSVAAGDYDGRPSAEALQAVDGYNLLRTDQNGWIQLSTDGEQLWVEVERK